MHMFQQLMFLVATTTANTTEKKKSGWSLDSFFTNLIKAIQKYGGYALMAIGAAALIWCIVQAFRKYVFQDQDVRMGPVTMIFGAMFGAAFMIGGWTLANSIGTGLNETANEFGGNGVALLLDLFGQ